MYDCWVWYCLAWFRSPGKGGKNRRRGKNENESDKRELVFKEDGQEYAQVIKMLGNGRLEAYCFDGVPRQCHIRGKLRKKVRVQPNSTVINSSDSQAESLPSHSPHTHTHTHTHRHTHTHTHYCL